MEQDKINWRREVTLTMLSTGKEAWEIEETIKTLEPIVFSLEG